MPRKKSTKPTKHTWLTLRVTQEERAAVQSEARAAGMTLSAYVLLRCLPPVPEQTALPT